LSYSSSSSAHESASPPTPSESFSEPHIRDKSRPPLVPDSLHTAENGQTNLYSAIHSLLRPNQRKQDASEAPHLSKRGLAPAGDPLGIALTRSQLSGTVTSAQLRRSQPPSPSSPGPRLGVDDAGSIRSSCHSTATSDAGAGIGLSMLQDFLPGTVDDGEDDEDEGGEDSDHETSSQSERGRTSLEETVDGFPAPPTQIPTPSSQATSFILDARRPISSASEDSEDGDGASLYDNYRYSRLSVSSKMSKSSGYTVATIPPPIPTELPPPVRSHSQDSATAPPSEPLSPSSSEPSSSVSLSPHETTPPTAATRATIRAIPPPLTLENSWMDLELSNSNLATATVTSPLLHANFGAPQSPPRNPNSPAKSSPIAAAFDLRERGSALALRQKVEQAVVEVGNEGDLPVGIRRTSPLSPTHLTAATGSSIARTPLEKKKRSDGPPPLVVMNPTPPPPYTPKSPPLPQGSGTPLTPTFTAFPTPTTTPIPSRAGAIAEPTTTDAPQPLTTTITTSSTNLFLPHPNAPKPNSSPQAPLYGRTMPSAAPLHSTLLIQAMRRAAQMRVAPNGLPRFSTIYGTTAQDLTLAAGPVLIYFSLDPPNDVPANRMRAAPIAVSVPALPPPPPPPPVPISNNQNTLSLAPAPGAQQPSPSQPSRRQGAGATTDSIPRAGFVPRAGAARPRSRSFSGFDSALAPETQPKEQRHVLHSVSPFSLLMEDLSQPRCDDERTSIDGGFGT
jgi:TBC1 domain family member 10